MGQHVHPCSEPAAITPLLEQHQDTFRTRAAASSAEVRAAGGDRGTAFAQLEHRQGLTRFHRRVTSGVRVEFALHCMAFNLNKALGTLPEVSCVVSVRMYALDGGHRGEFPILIAIAPIPPRRLISTPAMPS